MKFNLIMGAKEKYINKKNILLILSFLFNLGTIGIGGYFGHIWQDSVEDSMVISFQNKFSLPSQLMKLQIDSIAKNSVNELKTSTLLTNLDAYNKMYLSVTRYKGLTDEEAAKFISDKLSFADSIQKKLPELTATLEWVKQKQSIETIEEKYFKCAYVLSDKKTGKPVYFVEPDGDLKQIRKGRPEGLNLNGSDSKYYYRNDNDIPILITTLNNH